MPWAVICNAFGVLALLHVAALLAQDPQQPSQEPSRRLATQFAVNFRTTDYDPDFLLPVGQGEIWRDTKGLTISYAPGNEALRQDTGLYSEFSIRGDFQATLAYEILRADQPKTGPGVGPALKVKNQGGNGILLARRTLPDGTTAFVADRHQRVDGKLIHQIKTLPSTTTRGKLRLERAGKVIRCQASEGNDPKFITVAEVEFGRGDLHWIHMLGSTGETASGLELRLYDFAVRAEALLGMTDQVGTDRGIRQLDRHQLADLEEKVLNLYARLAPSVVRIVNPKRPQGGFSGVIVGPAGEILTCAHHDLPPKTKVLVHLADGRKVNATILGSVKQTTSSASRRPGADISMVLLEDKGDWPAAALGRSGDRKLGDFCLALGQPNVHKPGQPPLVRLGRLLAPDPFGNVRTTSRIQPGDSGGPLFDLDGRVLGVHMSIESLKRAIHKHSPVEGFLKVRDQLRAGEYVLFEKDIPEQTQRRKEARGSWAPTAELCKTLGAAHRSTVEVLGDGKEVAFGIVVEPDGWVMTKRSELYGPGGLRRLVCRLADGRTFPADVMGQCREHDLALLKVSATGLPLVRWAKSDALRVGQVVASLCSRAEPLGCGIVGALHVKNPARKGYLPIRVAARTGGGEGVAFDGFLPSHRQVDDARSRLKTGDIITHLDDVPTPSMDEFARVRDKRQAAPHTFTGEWLKLTVRRDAGTDQVFLPLVDAPVLFPTVWATARWNARRDGFPDVFSHDCGIAHNECGGAVVDRTGAVIGINIARADPMQTFAIPSNVVQTVIDELKSQAPKRDH